MELLSNLGDKQPYILHLSNKPWSNAPVVQQYSAVIPLMFVMFQKHLQEIASHGLLSNLQQLVSVFCLFCFKLV